MRCLFLTFAALTATSAAQTANNFFGLWVCTNFTSRGALGVNAGDNLLQVRTSHFSGIGHDAPGTGTVMTGFRHMLQDQDAATLESYAVIVRADAGGQPACTPAGVLLQTGQITSPGGTGTLAWQLTIAFATPSTALPLCATYYVGLSMPPAANWTADGLSSHIGSYYLLNGTQAGNPAPNAPQIAHNCVNNGPLPVSTNRTIQYEIMVQSAVLKLFNDDPTLAGNLTNCIAASQANKDHGVGGMWPEIGGGRHDGLGCRVDDSANAGGAFVCFLGVHAGLCPGIPLGALARGGLYLQPAAPIVLVAAGSLAAGTGRGQAQIVPPGVAPPSIVNRFVDFQAFTFGVALPGSLTNRASVQDLP